MPDLVDIANNVVELRTTEARLPAMKNVSVTHKHDAYATLKLENESNYENR